jgi:hypothetical protein
VAFLPDNAQLHGSLSLPVCCQHVLQQCCADTLGLMSRVNSTLQHLHIQCCAELSTVIANRQNRSNQRPSCKGILKVCLGCGCARCYPRPCRHLERTCCSTSKQQLQATQAAVTLQGQPTIPAARLQPTNILCSQVLRC